VSKQLRCYQFNVDEHTHPHPHITMAPHLTAHGRSSLILEDVTTDRPVRRVRIDDPFVGPAVDAHPEEQQHPPQRNRTFSRGLAMFLSFFAMFQVLALLVRVGSSRGVPELRNFLYLTG
jgi:hypothetical protein